MTATPKPRAGEHTKGPWKAVADTVHTLAGAQIADCSFAVKAEANARRIVACVNALEGFTTAQLENRAFMDLLRERERELVEALTKLSNEAASWREETLAELGGWTNARALAQRVGEARALLAKYGR